MRTVQPLDEIPSARFYVCEPALHCGSRRGRPLTGGYTDRHEAQAALEALSDEHPDAYLLPLRAAATHEETPVSVRSLTFDEARALHANDP
jgi:hypothetical protein